MINFILFGYKSFKAAKCLTQFSVPLRIKLLGHVLN